MLIFKIGFGKTGTTSLHKALQVLGLRSCHDNTSCDRATDLAVNLKFKHRIFKLFDAFTDGEGAARRFKLLYDSVPETTKFILTTRDVERWIDSKIVSILRHRVRTPGAAHSMDINTEQLRKEFLWHENDVKEFFADKPDRLLVFNCCDGGHGYPELCKFLGRPVPTEQFPMANVSQRKIEEIKRQLARRE